jgi:chemotaxis protein methyltransferase CheR
MSTLTQTDDYVEFCTFLRSLCGIDLAQYKRPQMERRLRSFYASRGITRLTDTFAQLRKDPKHLDELLDRITINVSQLWRNPEQWEIMEKTILPELAASGQLATLCHLVCPTARTLVRGTDIDKRMVARARLGLFSTEDARTAPRRQLEAGFDAVDGGWRAKLTVRAKTRFDVGDLLRIKPSPNSYDLILCRNTVIYFSEPIRDDLHARLAGALRPGGYLVIGSTERVSQPSGLGLTSAHPFIYRKA